MQIWLSVSVAASWSLFLFFSRCFVSWAHSSCYDYRVSTTWPHPVSLRSTARSSTSPRHETAIVYQQPLILCSLECVCSARPLFGTFYCRSKSACRTFIVIVSYQKMCVENLPLFARPSRHILLIGKFLPCLPSVNTRQTRMWPKIWHSNGISQFSFKGVLFDATFFVGINDRTVKNFKCLLALEKNFKCLLALEKSFKCLLVLEKNFKCLLALENSFKFLLALDKSFKMSPRTGKKASNVSLHWTKASKCLLALEKKLQMSPCTGQKLQNVSLHWKKTSNISSYWKKASNVSLHWTKASNVPSHWKKLRFSASSTHILRHASSSFSETVYQTSSSPDHFSSLEKTDNDH